MFVLVGDRARETFTRTFPESPAGAAAMSKFWESMLESGGTVRVILADMETPDADSV